MSYTLPFPLSKQVLLILHLQYMHAQLNPISPPKSLKKSLSPRRTPSPMRKSPSSQRGLRSGSKPTAQQQSDAHPLPSAHPISAKMIAARDNLTQTLDTYTLLIRSKNPIRCLQHNSSISLYCQTEQKLLCANCIFGRLQHKFHRVTPIDRSYERIEKDIETMNRLINREIDVMRKTNQGLVENLLREENDAHQALGGLVQVYEECHRRLEEGFMTAKGRIIARIDTIRERYEKMMYELKLNLENYSAGAALRPVGKDFFKREEILLYEHAVCSAIAAQRKFEWNEWVDGRREVGTIGGEEKKKIGTVRDAIVKALGQGHGKK